MSDLRLRSGPTASTAEASLGPETQKERGLWACGHFLLPPGP